MNKSEKRVYRNLVLRFVLWSHFLFQVKNGFIFQKSALHQLALTHVNEKPPELESKYFIMNMIKLGLERDTIVQNIIPPPQENGS